MKISSTLLLLFSLVAFTNCSKDFLKSYDERIIGTWRLTDVDRVGIGGNTNTLAFTSGTFVFHENGSLDYTTPTNNRYKGSWEIIKKTINDETVRSLQITAVDFTNQEVLTEYYDEMQFTSTDHFKANSVSGWHTYVTHFRR